MIELFYLGNWRWRGNLFCVILNLPIGMGGDSYISDREAKLESVYDNACSFFSFFYFLLYYITGIR